jgi:hypothetical protein
MGVTVSKLIAGFLLGVIATITVVFLLDGKTREIQESPTVQSVLPVGAAEVEQSILAKKIDEAPEEDGEELDMSASTEPVSYAEPFALQAESIGATQPENSATSPVAGPTARTTIDDYPPEIADMIENRVDKDLQERYESDEREDSWAQYMEGQLAAYFAQKHELAQFSFSMIDCRTSICEIHVLGYGPDALTLWNVGTADIVTQTWHDFRSMSINRHNPQPDILAIVLILSRKPPD